MGTARAPAVALAAVLALGACGDDGGGGEEASVTTETTTLDPGVTFPDDVTVPSTARPGAPTTTLAPGEVDSQPGEVPSQFPDDFPVPEEARVEIGSVGRAEGELRLAVDYVVPREDPAAVMDFYRDALAAAGFAVLLDDDDGRGQGFVGQLAFETDRYVGNVLVSGDGNRGVLLTLTATMPD